MSEICIIIPVYNRETTLERCVNSIISQSFADWTLLLVDDGSTDGSGKLCDHFAAADRRIQVLHKENGGVSSARNAGLDWAFQNDSSRWLSFIDSDDWIHPQMLEALRTAVTQTNLQIGAVSYKEVSSDADVPNDIWDSAHIEIRKTEAFFCGDNVAATVPWGKLYRKQLYEGLRYPVGKIHEDEFLTYRIIFQSEQIAYVPDQLYWYYQDVSGITRSKWNVKRLDKVQALKEQIDWFEKNGHELAHRARITTYAWYVGECIRELSESDIPDKAAYIKRLRNQLRSLLREKRALLSPKDIKVKWIFQIAYPVEMNVHRFFRRAVNRLRAFGA